jgi:hypothetical protein
MRIFSGCIALSLLALSAPLSAEPADEGSHPLCMLARYEERLDLEARELAVDRADSRLVAAEQIFALVDALWKDELIERIVHLAAKHDRDVAQVDVKRQRLALRRQQAVVEIYESYCSTTGDEKARTRSLEEAQRKYLQADCHRIGKDLAIAEADLAFHTEWLASILDLRENGVATAQEVILAEEDVEVARNEVRYHQPRVQACIDSAP